jgi:hypothetical protein
MLKLCGFLQLFKNSSAGCHTLFRDSARDVFSHIWHSQIEDSPGSPSIFLTREYRHSVIDLVRVMKATRSLPSSAILVSAVCIASFFISRPLVDACLSKYVETEVTNLNKTLSCGAQRDTILFSGFFFITGNIGSDSFLPGGKIADFFGFQYMRANDLSQKGHTVDFQTVTSLNVLYILTHQQRQTIIDSAYSEDDTVQSLGYKRFTLMKAFRRLLYNDIPSGAVGLSKEEVKRFSAELFRTELELSYSRASFMSSVIRNFTDAQYNYLANLTS